MMKTIHRFATAISFLTIFTPLSGFASNKPDSVAPEQLGSLLDYKEPAYKAEGVRRFSGATEAGLTNSTGSSIYSQFDIALKGCYENGIDEVNQSFSYRNLESTGKLTANDFISRSAYDRYLGSRFWSFAIANYEYAPLKGLNGDFQAGLGIKYDILRNSFWKFNFGTALLNRQQWATNGATRNDYVMSFRWLFRIKFSSVSIGSTLTYQPSLTDANNGILADVHAVINPDNPLNIKVSYNYSDYAQPFNRQAPGIDSYQSIDIVYNF